MSAAIGGVLSDKEDLVQAINYALDFFDLWRKEGRLTPEQHQVLAQYYQENRQRVETGGPPTEEMVLRKPDTCWSCRAAVDPHADFCVDCGAPLQSGSVQRLRYLIFLCYEIKKHEAAGRISLATAHDLMADGNSRIAALRRKLEKDRIPMVQVVAAPAPTAETAPRQRKAPPTERAINIARPRRSVVEILLDPRTIQWLLASGGALLVLGLIIWLAADRWFENKLFVAVLLGTGNAALLGGGWALIYFTRYQTAGRAVTLLACLLMPLNLWFYDYQELVEIKHGGPLWFPALVCCVLYAVSARLLKDAMFVPVFVGGVVMTGLLLLGDQMLQRIWEITAPATLLVLLGIAFLHVERLFPEGDGPFSRRKFGLAFFWSGHVVLASGLLLLLVAQLFGGWLFPLVKSLYDQNGFTQPEVVTTWSGKWLALVLVLAGTYAYVYSDIVVRHIGVYLSVAVFTLLWAEVLLVAIFADYFGDYVVEVAMVALAFTGLLANLAIVSMGKRQATLLRIGAPLALFLCAVPVLLGVLLQIQGTIAPNSPLSHLHHPLAWPYVFAMAVTAVSCRTAAHLYRHERKGISAMYFFGTAAATLAGAAGLLVVVSEGRMAWHDQAPLLMIIPILYLIASRLYRGHTAERPLGWVAHAATAVMLLVSVELGTWETLQPVPHTWLYLMLAVFFAETTLFYGLAAVTREKAANVYLATAAAFAAVWQLFYYFHLSHEWYTLAFAVVGLVLLILYRFAVLEKFRGGLAEAAFQCANAMLLLAFAAAALITGTELLLHFDAATQGIWNPQSEKMLLVPMLMTMVGASLLAVALVKHQGWRRLYVGTSVINAALAVLVLVTLGTLSLPQKMEIAALILGVLLLGAGHYGWYREQDQHNDLTSMALIFGSLLVTVPFTIAVVAGRLHMSETWFYVFNEIGMLAVGLVLLAAGNACQLKAPTLAGAFMTVVWLMSLVLYLRLPDRLQTTAVYMMVGGGTFFAVGLLLSIYRDRLLTLPERIKRHEGVFRVLGWR